MERLALETKNITDENIKKILELFPNIATEALDENGNLKTAIDFEKLKQELSEVAIDGEESYDFTWVGKKEAIIEANRPIRKTLRPDRESSVDWENTENIYIEGDNLDALKLLQESYLGKVKMIYIDPPYNTGKDFVYKDNFTQDKESYNKELGLKDEDENKLFQNTESNGRFHSDWCSMIYSRLKLARNLLSDDGVIFISIDENEYDNLKKLCDELFGISNFIENFIWIKNSTKNLSKTTSTNHEYILCYSKDKTIIENCDIFRVEKPGLKEVLNILQECQKKKITILETQNKLRDFYKSRNDLKGISMYDRVDYKFDTKTGENKLSAFRLSDISAPKSTGKAATYDVIHPITGKVCKVPSRGWAYKEETMREHLKNNLIYFSKDETGVPQYKRYLNTVTTEVIKSTFEDFNDGKKDLMNLFQGDAYFENAKPTTLINKFLKCIDKNAIILDFFSGSATTAHACMQLNAEDGGNRKFIMVQLPEKTDEKSEAFKAGYKNICEIGEERIRRAGKKIQEENPDKKIDIGFRVFKIDDTNMKDVYYTPDETDQKQLGLYESNIKDDRTDEDLLYGCLLDWGVELSLPHKVEIIDGKRVHIVDEDALVACFEEDIPESVIRKIAGMKPLRVVFRDSSFISDDNKINIEEIFKLITPDTRVKVI